MNHKWTEDELLIIRRDFKHTKQSCRELAQIITLSSGEQITEYAVRDQISSMGICHDGRKTWDEKQDKRLRHLMGKYHPARVAKIMHRGVNSVVIRPKRLGISRRTRDGWFTKKEVCEIFGVDHHWVQHRIDSGALLATPHGETKPCKNGGSCWHIEDSAVVDFIRRYPQELVGKNIDIIQIVDILVGIESLQ